MGFLSVTKCADSAFFTLGEIQLPGFSPKPIKEITMNVTLVGASGNVGTRILSELGRRGHTVTAIVRNPERVPAQPGVTAVKGDVSDQKGLVSLLKGHDAVIS